MATLGYDPDPETIEGMAAYCANEFREMLARGETVADAAAYADRLMRDWCRRHAEKARLRSEPEVALAAAR